MDHLQPDTLSRPALRPVPATPVPHSDSELNAQTRLIFNAAPDAIVGIDAEGRILIWNAEAERLYGWKSAEVLGVTLAATLFPDRYRAAYQQRLEPCMRTGARAGRMELSTVHRDGRELPVELRLVSIREEGQHFYCAYIRDLGERHEGEQLLRESEQKFTALVQNSSDMITILDEGGNYLYASPSVTAILGYGPTDFQQRRFAEFIHEEDLGRIQTGFQQLLGQDTATAAPYRFRAADGSWRWIESYGTNLLHDDAIRGLVINSHDVTDRMLLEQELEEKTRSLQRAMTAAVIQAQETERAQLGQELHDNVNQVLTSIKLYLGILRDGVDEPRALIDRATTHLQGCIDEIRSISKRLSAPTLGSISLADSLRELVESINLSGRIAVRHCIEGLADQGITRDQHLAVYRIVQEALYNIIKYSEADSAAILLSQKQDHLNLQVYDNGRGFDIHARHAGIGITNMRSRAEHLHGTFRIESTPGNGTVIKVSIPLR